MVHVSHPLLCIDLSQLTVLPHAPHKSFGGALNPAP